MSFTDIATANIKRGEMNLDLAEQAMTAFISALGFNLDNPGLRETPRRVAQAYAELLTPRSFETTIFDNDAGFGGIIQVHGVPFVSVCEHHMFPFHGTASIGYIPTKKLLGLSKLARAVQHLAANPQLQERMTAQIAAWVANESDSNDVGVVLSAVHSCMSWRGAQAIGAHTVTSELRGRMADDARINAEFLRHAPH